MIKAYKYRIYPNKDQEEQIEKHFGSCRLVYNLALTTRIYYYSSFKKTLSRYDLQVQLVELKKEYPWLYDTCAQSLQSSLLNLDKAFKNLFNGGGFPAYKSKNGRQSFQYPQDVKVDFGNKSILMPKIGSVKASVSRVFEGFIKTCTVSRVATGKYFISILVDDKKELPIKGAVVSENTIGLDVGIKSFVVSSDGRSFEANRQLKKNLDRLRVLQRRVSQKRRGSANRRKAQKKVSLLHERIANSRIDFIQKTTSIFVRDSQAASIVVEDLNISGMLKNRKLSQAIGDVSWGKFFSILEYKCDWYGKNLIRIGRFEPSSKLCSDCGAHNQSLTLRDREWVCAECGTLHDRDLNAAKNIKQIGLLKYSGVGSSGESVESRPIGRAKKQKALSISNTKP